MIEKFLTNHLKQMIIWYFEDSYSGNEVGQITSEIDISQGFCKLPGSATQLTRDGFIYDFELPESLEGPKVSDK